MVKLTKFRLAILTALATIPDGNMQRIDGLRCERGVLEHNWRFFRFRLQLMEWAGLISSRPVRSFWPSLSGMPAFWITPAGRLALSQYTKVQS